MAKVDDSLNQAFGAALRGLRKKAGFSQQDLAFECELDRTYISLLERGLRQPTIATMFTLSEQLGIKPSKLVKIVENLMSVP